MLHYNETQIMLLLSLEIFQREGRFDNKWALVHIQLWH